MAPRSPAVRHRLIVEQVLARQGRLSETTTSTSTSTSTTAAAAAAASAIARFSPVRLNEANDYLTPWSSMPNASLTERLPGLKASATFLSSLRTNLSLPDCPSPQSTSPLLPPLAATSLPTPSPLIVSSTLPPPSMDDDIDSLPAPPTGSTISAAGPEVASTTTSSDPPPLSTYKAADPTERRAALKLVADSIAQQSSEAHKALLYHPLNLTVLIAFLAWFARRGYHSRSDLGIALITTFTGILMSFLFAIRYLGRGYILAAEEVRADTIDGRDVWVTRYGDEIIGTAVVAWDELDTTAAQTVSKRRKAHHHHHGARKAEVVAWTVRIRYRGRGIGEGLLEAVVDDVKARGGDVAFRHDHANSKRFLWDMYNARFETRDRRARAALADVWEKRAGGGKRKR